MSGACIWWDVGGAISAGTESAFLVWWCVAIATLALSHSAAADMQSCALTRLAGPRRSTSLQTRRQGRLGAVGGEAGPTRTGGQCALGGAKPEVLSIGGRQISCPPLFEQWKGGEDEGKKKAPPSTFTTAHCTQALLEYAHGVARTDPGLLPVQGEEDREDLVCGPRGCVPVDVLVADESGAFGWMDRFQCAIKQSHFPIMHAKSTMS